jgi:DNA-binding IclR family transcriptional regulator
MDLVQWLMRWDGYLDAPSRTLQFITSIGVVYQPLARQLYQIGVGLLSTGCHLAHRLHLLRQLAQFKRHVRFWF